MICEPRREPSRLRVRRRGCSAAARDDGTVIATGSNDHGWPGRLIPRWANRDAAPHPLPKERQCLGGSPRIPRNGVMAYPSRPVLEVLPQFRDTASVTCNPPLVDLAGIHDCRNAQRPAAEEQRQDRPGEVIWRRSGHRLVSLRCRSTSRTAFVQVVAVDWRWHSLLTCTDTRLDRWQSMTVCERLADSLPTRRRSPVRSAGWLEVSRWHDPPELWSRLSRSVQCRSAALGLAGLPVVQQNPH